MARSSTTWKPGNAPKSPGGPKGPRLPIEVRQLKDEAKAEAIKAVSEGLLYSVGELRDLLHRSSPYKPDSSANPDFDPYTPVLNVLVGRVISAAMEYGDVARLCTLLNYVVGKPKPESDDDNDESDEDGGKALKQIPSAVLIEVLRLHSEGSKKIEP